MEKLYHYLWKTRLLGKKIPDNSGNEIEVIDPGICNMDAGPDFFNAKLKVGDTVWIGNVEIHVKASDWFRHGHDNDPAYDNIILHVVGISDKEIKRKDGSTIPQIELTFPEEFFYTVGVLSENINQVRCSRFIKNLPELNVIDWLETLTVERMQQKAGHILDLYRESGNDWEQTAFIVFSRALGFGLNSVPFELVAKRLPLKILHRHSDNIFQIQALVFGQAALLDPSIYFNDSYYQSLCSEYYFLARKYDLSPIKQGLWKFSRTRPHNFPHRRLAFLSQSCENGFSLFSKIIETDFDIDDLKKIFNWEIGGYWDSHFSFGVDARSVSSHFTSASLNLLMINVVVPLIYAYSSVCGDFEKGEKALTLLSEITAENNTVIRQWKDLGLTAKDARHTQALIHLRKNYCDAGKCLYCRFGYYFLRKAGENY